MMKREEQIEFIKGCEERVRGYVGAWLRNPLFREALHRPCGQPGTHDPNDEPEQTPMRRYG